MNKMMTTVVAFGAGMAVYGIADRNNMISNRNIRKVKKMVKRMF